MMAATEKLRPLLEATHAGTSWRVDEDNFHPGPIVPTGVVTLSSGWFEVGKEVSSLACKALPFSSSFQLRRP